jgi:hypothetical protein
MYFSAFSAAARSTESAISVGSGTFADSGAPCPGLVPQVTKGVMSAASRTTSLSKTAPSSVNSMRHRATASSHRGPLGEY